MRAAYSFGNGVGPAVVWRCLETGCDLSSSTIFIETPKRLVSKEDEFLES